MADPHYMLGVVEASAYPLSWILGAHDRSVAAFRRLLALDPSQLASRSRFAEIHLTLDNVDSARHHIEEALRQEPGAARARATAGLIEVYAGDYAAAVAHLDPLLEREPPVLLIPMTGVVIPTVAGFAHQVMGNGERGRELYARSEAWHERSGNDFPHHSRYDRVRLAAIRGNVDGALTVLEEMEEEGRWPFYYTYMGETDPVLENLHGHPRFHEIMATFRDRMDRQRERVLSYSLPLSEEDVRRVLEEVRRDVEDVDYLPE